MTHSATERHYLFANGMKQTIGPDDPKARVWHESLIRADYEATHPGDTFDGLKARASFLKEDKGLLRDWMALAAARAKRQSVQVQSTTQRPLAA